MSKFYCGIDLGGTKICIGVFNEKCDILALKKIKTNATIGKEEIIKNIKSSIVETCLEANISINDISKIGIGSAGNIDSKKGIINYVVNLPDFINVPIKDILENEFKIETELYNDANVATYGEYKLGVGKGSKNFVYMTVSTGIGGGVVLNGELYEGANSNACEFGHATIDYKGEKCRCGNYGCLDNLASGTAVRKRAISEIKKGRESRILEIAKKSVDEIKAEDVFKGAELNDELCKEIVSDVAFYLGVGISNIIIYYNPEIIAIGGGVSKSLCYFYDDMMKIIKERTLKSSLSVCSIKEAKLKDNIGVMGIAALFKDNM